MAKKADGTVKVLLKCTYSDGAENPGPGSVIELDAEEAQRLYDLGAAEAYVAPAEAPAAPATE